MPSSNLVNYLIPDHYIQRQYDSVGLRRSCAVPTIFIEQGMVGTLRFAHPTDY
jgi:hypothetical protein